MALSGKTCRLCLIPEAMTNLFAFNGETTLDKKIHICIGLKVSPADELPAVICKKCETNINNFYDFKKKCLLVDSKLKTEKLIKFTNSPTRLTLDDTDLDNFKMDIKFEYNIFNKEDSDLNNSFNSWLSDDADSAFYVAYLDNQKAEEIESPSRTLNNSPLTYNKKPNIKKQSRNKEIAEPYKYQCEICGCILKNKSVLVKHVQGHSGIKQFSCKICSKAFTRAEHKAIHMRTHLGIKPYICERCGKPFTKRQDLVRHMRIHNDEKNYACPRCDRRFKRSGDVHSHMRTHTGAKPYSCSLCGKSYSSHSGLRKHHKMHCKRENTIIK